MVWYPQPKSYLSLSQTLGNSPWRYLGGKCQPGKCLGWQGLCQCMRICWKTLVGMSTLWRERFLDRIMWTRGILPWSNLVSVYSMKLSGWLISSVMFVYCVWRSEDNFWGAVFSFYPVGPSQAYDTRHGCKRLYLLSNPARDRVSWTPGCSPACCIIQDVLDLLAPQLSSAGSRGLCNYIALSPAVTQGGTENLYCLRGRW